MQKHREHLDFAIQSNNAFDAMIFAQLINALLPRGNRLEIATAAMMLAYTPNPAISCPECRIQFEITKEMLQEGRMPKFLPKNFVPPKPSMITTSQKLAKSESAWEWLEHYLIQLEGHVSDITWQKTRTYKE